jgi:hypothetical protein
MCRDVGARDLSCAGSVSVAHTKAFGQRVAIAIAIAPEPVPTSATRTARVAMRSLLSATSRSVVARGVMTRPGAVFSASPLNVTSVRRVRVASPTVVTSGSAFTPTLRIGFFRAGSLPQLSDEASG